MATTVNTFVEFKNNLSMMVKQVVADFDKKTLLRFVLLLIYITVRLLFHCQAVIIQVKSIIFISIFIIHQSINIQKLCVKSLIKCTDLLIILILINNII